MTSYTLIGPSTGLVNVASGNFTVTLGEGTLSGSVTITPNDSNDGGTFAPTSVLLSTLSPSATFTYTPNDAGSKTIATSNDGDLSDPSSLTYDASSSLLLSTPVIPVCCTITGPSSGNANAASSNFTITPVQPYITITVTPSGGGLSTPIVKTWNGNTTPQTFTITPSQQGTVILQVSNNAYLMNPYLLQYVSVSTGAATSYGLSGPITGTVNDTLTFTITPDGTYSNNISVVPYGAGLQYNLNHPITTSWSSTSSPKTFTLAPTKPGPILIYTKTSDNPGNDGGLTDSPPFHVYVNPPTTANRYTLEGPFSGAINTDSTDFTVTLNAPPSGTVGVDIAVVGGGLNTTVSLSFSGSTVLQTFRIHPTSATTVTLTPTNDGGLTNPATLYYGAQSLISIDQNWLDNNGPEPYCLAIANRIYQLTLNVTAVTTAFAIVADYVTFDLNGKTITYDESPATSVLNGGFENGSGSTIPNWDVTGAPGAQILATSAAISKTGWWGSKVLQIPNIANGNSVTFVSDPIAIPTAGLEYCAMIQPKIANPGVSVDGHCVMQVIDTVTSQPIESIWGPGSYGGGETFSVGAPTLCYFQFVPSTTHDVKLSITASVTYGSSASFVFDHADLCRSREMGIIASATPHTNSATFSSINDRFPSWTSNNVTIKNGYLVQGTGRSVGQRPGGCPITARGTNNVVINNMHITHNGAFSQCITASSTTGLVSVTNCTIEGGPDIIDDRQKSYAAIDVSSGDDDWQVVLVANNTVNSKGQNGIEGGGSRLAYGRVLSNTLTMYSGYTDCYAIGLGGPNGFEIAYNDSRPTNGRGMYFGANDGFNALGLIHDNYMEAREAPSLEYSRDGIEATVLRWRNGAQNSMTLYNNTFAAYAGSGTSWACTGARIGAANGIYASYTAHINDISNNVFVGNTFKAILNSFDSANVGQAQASQAWGSTISRMEQNTWPMFYANTFASNVTPLNIGDSDSGDGVHADISFISNVIEMVTDEGLAPNSTDMRPFSSFALGDWNTQVNRIHVYDMSYTNGAPSGLTFLSGYAEDVEIGWLLDVLVVRIIGGVSTPVVGATVTIIDTNGSGAPQFCGTTDANGYCLNIDLLSDKYYTASGGGNNATPSHTSYNQFEVSATSSTYTGSQAVTLDQTKSITITIS